MNPIVLNLLGPPKPSAHDASAAGAASTLEAGADDFGQLLAGRVKSLLTPAKSAPASNAASAKSALEGKIAKMLRAGTSASDIASTLAAQLAASVAQALGTTTADARAQLQAVFAGALAPPGGSGKLDGSIDGRAYALAQRFEKLQGIANTIVGELRPGQQNRIAGNFLDADSAKETPAQAPKHTAVPLATTTPQRAPMIGTTAVPASTPAPTAPAPATVVLANLPNTPVGGVIPALPNAAPAGDGRTVKSGAKLAIAAGGDTLLGRVLTRATLVDDARTASRSGGDALDTFAEPVADATTGNAPGAAKPNDVAAFVKSFEAALGGAPKATTGAARGTTEPVAANLPIALPVSDAPGATTAFTPPVAPLRIEAPVPATSTAHAAPVPVDQSAIVDQVLRGAFLRTNGASSEMRLNLVPETLGDVSVKLVVTAGNVTAHVVAQTTEVRDALVAAQPQLTKSLADAGLKLQSFTVDLSGGGFAGFSQQQNTPWQNGNRTNNAPTLADESTDDSALDAIPSFGPPIFDGLGAGDYNYLA